MQRRGRGDDGGSVLGSIWCGTLGIILIWLVVISIVYGLLIWDAHNRLDDFERRLERAEADIEDNEECCEEITDSVNEFRPCLDEYCAPNNFPRLLDAVICRGCWNANLNNPMLTSGVGINADLYYVCVAGSTSLEGITDWEVGDALKFIDNTPSGPKWIKNDGSPEVIPDVEVSLTNLVGDDDDGDSVLANPGTGSSFDFRQIEAGIALSSVVTPERIVLNFGTFTRKAQFTAIYSSASDFDPIKDDDFKEDRCHYYRVTSMCPAGSQALTCASCYTVTVRTNPNNPPAGQHSSRPKSFSAVENMRTIRDAAVNQWCICDFAVLDVSIADGTGTSAIKFVSEVVCVN